MPVRRSSSALRVLGSAAASLLVFANVLIAQTGRIEGRVTAEATGDPIPGALVRVAGTALSATTNENGFYTIPSVPVGSYSVRVAAVGFQSVLYTNQVVTAGQTTTVSFSLRPTIFRLDDVVVTGVAEQTRGVKVPFVVEKVSMADIPVPAQNAVETIRGKMPGVKIVRGSGRPGDGVSVLLRGATSINTSGRSNEPLYVVDGVILNASIVDIDALDVVSVEVVKGAAGAALYGARAANGVIVIRTNRGRDNPEGQTRVTFRSEFGRNSLFKKIPQAQSHWYQLDANGNWIMEKGSRDTLVSPDDRALATRQGWRPKIDYQIGPQGNRYAISDNPFPGKTYDNLDLFFEPGVFYTNTATISHRTGNTNFVASFHETKESGIVDGLEGYLRRGGRVNVDHRIGGQLDFSASAFYSQSAADDPIGGENAFYGLNFYPIDVNLKELNPNPRNEKDYLINPDQTVVEANPLYSAQNNDQLRRRSRFLGSFRARWRPTEVFDLETDFSFDRSDRNTTIYFFRGFRTVDAPFELPGELTKQNGVDQAINASLTAALNKSFGGFNTVTKLRALLERAQGEFFSATANELVVSDVKDLDVGNPALNQITSSSDEIRSLGYFLSTQIDFKERYIIDALIRRDGSSLFGSEERWNTYYRLSGAYRMAEEPWWPLGFVNEFKLRASQGTAGGRPNFFAQYETFNVSQGQVSKGTLGNKKLKPELATEREVGVDVIGWGRLSLGLTYAKSVVEDQILLVPLPGYVGFSNQWRNAGTLESKTWEGSLEAAILQGRNLSWTVNFVIDRTRQVITDLKVPAYLVGGLFYIRKGERFGTMWGHRWATKCSDIFSPTNGFGASCDQFDVNDDGYLVPVGQGNKWTDGIDKQLYGTRIVIDGVTYDWGLPFRAKEIIANPVTGQVDTTDFVRIGNTEPDFNWGLTNTINFKGLTLYALLEAQVGGQIYNNTRQWPARELNAWEVDQRGKPENHKKPLDYYQRLYNVNAPNSHYVEDASYVKLREVRASYSFDLRGSGILGGFVKRIGLSLIGRNLITWTDYTGYDPEVSTFAEGVVFRYDGFGYPNFRTITGSIELEF